MYLQMQVDRYINEIGLKDCNLVVKLYCYLFNLFLCLLALRAEVSV